jgi:glutamine synthetase
MGANASGCSQSCQSGHDANEIIETVRSVITDDVNALDKASTKVFNEAAMTKYCGGSRIVAAFNEAVRTGAELDEASKKTLADGMFKWARENGATSFAHWFFPCRWGSGATGGTLGALKYDTFIDLVWSSTSSIKPFEATFPVERLFVGETDGSSFPNGGLRATHTAAAFTIWDRSSPVFIFNGVMRIPCCFVTHYGKCIDLKTPLLRSADAVTTQGLRLLKAMSLSSTKVTSAKRMWSYVGWEQEFFVSQLRPTKLGLICSVAAEHFSVACQHGTSKWT